jgi:predicted phosphoribosyltransferase
MTWFRDRKDAGEQLGRALAEKGYSDPVVFGLPRGGVVVAAEVAKALGATLDLVIARKLGHPHNREYAIGAVTDDGQALLNPAETSAIDAEWLERAVAREQEEARRKRDAYLGGAQPADIAGKTAIVVDDGIATGFTIRAAARALRARGPAKLVVAAPVAPPRTIESLRQEADEVVVLSAPEHLVAIGAYYEDFAPVRDDEVKGLLGSART